MFADGYTDLPPGKIASVVTYLEMLAPQATSGETPKPTWSLIRHSKPELKWYRDLFQAVGQDWLWFSRLQMDDDTLARTIHDAAVDVFSLRIEDEDKGLLELDRRRMPDIELAFIGLTADAIGQGAGRFLLNCAMEIAWSYSPRRVLVHTCTLDHPRALGLYRSVGFVPYKRSIELADDPRLNGTLPRRAAPGCPLL
jgi:GNAT superfamily N-acetyltransferase